MSITDALPDFERLRRAWRWASADPAERLASRLRKDDWFMRGRLRVALGMNAKPHYRLHTDGAIDEHTRKGWRAYRYASGLLASQPFVKG